MAQRQRPIYLILVLLAAACVACGCREQSARSQAFDATFSLQTTLVGGQIAFAGAAGAIEGEVNPDLVVSLGDTVRLTIANADGMPHDIAIPAFGIQTPLLTTGGQTVEVTFEATQAGEFAYYCAVSGHRQIGMEGRLIVIAGDS